MEQFYFSHLGSPLGFASVELGFFLELVGFLGCPTSLSFSLINFLTTETAIPLQCLVLMHLFSSFLSFKLYVRINLQNQMQNMHRQIFPLSILDTLFLLGQQVLKILKSLLDVTPTTIHITDCIVATFVVEAIKLRLKLFLFTASKTQRPGKTKQPSG